MINKKAPRLEIGGAFFIHISEALTHSKNHLCYMKIIKDFTCSVTDKRWKAGEEYTGERGQELADKGLIDMNALADVFELPETPEKAPQAPQEKLSISPIKKKKR